MAGGVHNVKRSPAVRVLSRLAVGLCVAAAALVLGLGVLAAVASTPRREVTALLVVGGLALVLPAAALMTRPSRVRRTPARGCCRACGYSLAGLERGARCPECGREPAGAESRGMG